MPGFLSEFPSSFFAAHCATANKRFCPSVSFGFRVSGCGGHGVTRPTVFRLTSDIGLPTIHEFSCVSCISWFNSPISTRSTRSTRLKSLTQNNSKLTFRLTAGYYASKTRLYQRSFIAHHDIADFPCPPSTEISAIISYFYVLLKVHLRNGSCTIK